MDERFRRIPPSRRNRPDLFLLGATVLLVILGIAAMASISDARVAMGREPGAILGKHLTRLGLGILLCIAGALIPVNAWQHYAKGFLLAALALLLFSVLPRFGLGIEGVHVARNGAYRWIHMGSLSLMPGELFKVALVMWLSHFLSLTRIRPERLKDLLYPVILCGTAVLFFILQPALSTAAGVISVAAAMLYLAGGPTPRLRVLACGGVAVAGSLMLLSASSSSWATHAPEASETTGLGVIRASEESPPLLTYVRGRLREYVFPWKWSPRRLCYHARQSLIALGFGGLTGQGLGNGRHSYGRLPESHTDYPLAAIGEELGLLGTTVVVVAWSVIFLRGMRIARNAAHLYSFLLAAGLTLNLALFAVANAAVVTALVPVTGQGMPLVSYGGVGTAVNLFSIGVIDAVNRSKT